MASTNPKKFGRYIVVSPLGAGAMGKVFLAVDPVLERKVALKVIAMDQAQDATMRADYLRRFTFEAKASAKLSHPSIVAVYDAGEEDGQPWIAFEYVLGETLETLIARKGTLPVGRAIAFARDIASALKHAHGWSIVHRDIKPANILIESASGLAKLADFGIVKAPWAMLSSAENTVGSPGYMSPEQIDGVDLDDRADLFCLGVVMYQMVAGRHPFLRDTLAATILATCNNDYTPLRDIADSVPRAFDWAVRRCLAPDRDKRIRSADELLDMLAKAGPGSAPLDVSRPAENFPSQDMTSSPANRTYASGPPAAALAFHFDKYKSLAITFVTRNFTAAVTAIRKTADDLGGPTEALFSQTPLSRLTKGQPGLSAALAAAGFCGLLAIICALVSLFIGGAPALPPRNSLQGQLITECAKALAENNRALAHNTVSGFATVHPLHPVAKILIARVNIRDGLYGVAKSVFLDVESTPDGRRVLKKQLPTVLDEIRRQLSNGLAAHDLLELVQYVLLAGRNPLVRSWVKSPSFWLRWNAVDILKASDVDVDMTPVYILDLNGRELIQARIEAVKKLGEIGSQRARAALKDAAARTQTDPIIAREAKRVLEEHQK